MLSGLSAGRIWLCTQPTDMRCSFDGLSARVRRYLGEESDERTVVRVYQSSSEPNNILHINLGPEIVEYPWHPLYRRRLTFYRQVGNRGGGVVHVKTPDGFSCELPQWMFDRVLCRAMDKGAPQVSVAALEELRDVLTLLTSKRAENALSDDDSKHGDLNEPTSTEKDGATRPISKLAAASSSTAADTPSRGASTGRLANRGTRRRQAR